MKQTTSLYRDQRRLIGANIHRFRKQKRMTLETLRRASGLSVTTLDCYELGKGNIALFDIVRIAAALGRAPAELLAKKKPEA